jgi:hypothetical protein
MAKALPGTPCYEEGFPLAELQYLLEEAIKSGAPLGAVFQCIKDDSMLDHIYLGRFIWEQEENASSSSNPTKVEEGSMPMPGDNP